MITNRFNFRVWDKENKKMIYLRDDESDWSFWGDCIFPYTKKEDKYILMQSIGLFDVAGKKIFKNDLIEFENTSSEIKFLCKVVYNAPAYELEIIKVLEDKQNRYKNMILKGQNAAFSIGEEDLIYKIVGNEFENKEL